MPFGSSHTPPRHAGQHPRKVRLIVGGHIVHRPYVKVLRQAGINMVLGRFKKKVVQVDLLAAYRTSAGSRTP